MNNEPENNSFRDNILKDIEQGKVKMKPKWHFILRASLLLTGIVFGLLVLLFVASFIMFVLRQTGVWFTPGFGFHGLGTFLTSLPWLLVLIGAVFIILLEILVKKYSFGYRKPLLYTTIALTVIVLVGGFVVAQTSFHSGLYVRARDKHLPLAGGLYREYGMRRPPGNVEVGTVIEKTNTGCRIKNRREELIEVITTPETRFPYGVAIEVGDNLVVMGKTENGIIRAFAIRVVDGNEFPPPRGPKPSR